MTKKIFQSILGVVTLVLITSFLFITMFLYNHFSNEEINKLKENLYLVSKAAENDGVEYLKTITDTNYRLTLIKDTGLVIFDSKIESSNMENHADREEIVEALKNGKGSSVRESETMTEQTLYEATKLSDGSILRMSTNTETITAIFLKMIGIVSLIYLLIILITIFISKQIAKKMMQPLNEINLEEPLKNSTYTELRPFLKKIDEQKSKIQNQIISIKQKSEEFDKVVNNMKEGLVVLDKNKNLLSINKAARKIFSNQEIKLGKNVLYLERKEILQEAITKAFEKRENSIRISLGKKEYQFDMSVIEADNIIIGLVLLIFDVTSKVQNEKMRREFTANVSHEFKTPLQSILGSVELIENGIVKKEDMPRFTNHIKLEAKRLVNLVEDVISLSKLDEGLTLEKEEINLRKMLESIILSLNLMARNKKININLEGDASVCGVRKLLYDVFYNLCDNAIKYNKPQGVVSIKILEHDNSVIIEIEDTGVGIDEKYKERIFERFYRVDTSHSKQSGGTGLGLAIVKNAIIHHQGNISVESQLGKGTKIIIDLPKKIDK